MLEHKMSFKPGFQRILENVRCNMKELKGVDSALQQLCSLFEQTKAYFTELANARTEIPKYEPKDLVKNFEENPAPNPEEVKEFGQLVDTPVKLDNGREKISYDEINPLTGRKFHFRTPFQGFH